jgi:HTH-type transcriptional regulator / antitoxin HipB
VEKEVLEGDKKYIAMSINNQMFFKNLSLRDTAALIDNFSHPQLARITTGKNYNIDTLLKVLDVLDLEIVITRKERK